MFSFGGSELLIIGALVLLLFGPDKIPQLARTIGRYTREFKKYRDMMESTLRLEMGEEPEKSEWQSDYEHRLAVEKAKAEAGIETPEGEAGAEAAEAEASGEIALEVAPPAAAAAQSAPAEECAPGAAPLPAEAVAATSEDDEEDEG